MISSSSKNHLLTPENIMQETTSPSIVINISGGNNQILPVATHAEQHYHYHTAGTGVAVSHCPHPGHPHDLQDHRLAIYINNVEDLSRYLTLLSACQSAAEVGRCVTQMVQHTPGLTIDTAKTEPFIRILLSLTPHIPSGTTVANYRKAIENAWYSRKD